MLVRSNPTPVVPEIRTFVVGGGDPSNSLEAAIAWLPADPIDDQSNGTDMLYSSGTTGRPKGIKPALPEGALDQPTPLTDMGARLWGLSISIAMLVVAIHPEAHTVDLISFPSETLAYVPGEKGVYR